MDPLDLAGQLKLLAADIRREIGPTWAPDEPSVATCRRWASQLDDFSLLARALAHRASAPETPQPAAESGWRERLLNQARWHRGAGRIEAAYAIFEAIAHADHRYGDAGSDAANYLTAEGMDLKPLPPVVQTRPED